MRSRCLRILLVEDDLTQATTVRHALSCVESASYDVQHVLRLDEALASLAREAFDAVLLDLGLPDCQGLETLEQLRQPAPDLPTVVLTAHDDEAGALRSLELGAQDYLLKGRVDGNALARAISYAIQRQRLLVENRRLLAEMKQLAWTDPLTGILNRRTFFELFKGEWSRSTRERGPLSCVLMDIDFFKRINDTLGHAAGDATLQVVARLLREHCRASDYLCRFGGEEFCILLPHANELGASRWAERLRQRIAEEQIEAAGKIVRITASFGVAERLEDTAGPEALVDRADQALLVAKQSGRDRVVPSCSLNDLAAFDSLGRSRPQDPFDEVLARDVMTAVVACLEQDDSVDEAARFLLQLRIGSAPVVDGEGKLAGIVSEKDLMALMASPESWRKTVRDIMRTNVVCYDEQSPARDVFYFLRRVSIRRVIVVQQGRPVGVISRGSLLRWFRNWVSVHDPHSLAGEWGLLSRAAVCPELLRTADALAQRSCLLPQYLRTNIEDYVPYVVGEATCMQELINDLLGHCQDGTMLGIANSE
ncbi:MAG: diguanylate cyclase [Planctomycetes bacterium]|nr:diguanylate cyclase [Planctomycetota bacterium]